MTRLICYFIWFSFLCSIIVGCTVDSFSDINSGESDQSTFKADSDFSILIFNQEHRLEIWEVKKNQPFQFIDSFQLPNSFQFLIGSFQFDEKNRLYRISSNETPSSKTKYFRTAAYPSFSNNSTDLFNHISNKIKSDLLSLLIKKPFKIWVFPNDKRIDGHFIKATGRIPKEVELLVLLESILSKYKKPE